MTAQLTSARVEQLKRAAKKLARTESIPLHQAQQHLANKHGYANWSLLHKHSTASTVTAQLVSPIPSAIHMTPESHEIVLANPNRHYLHGDQHEFHLTHFYCRSCDLFVTHEHFFKEHDRRDTLERALNALTRWYNPSNENSSMRPHSAYNMLVEPAR